MVRSNSWSATTHCRTAAVSSERYSRIRSPIGRPSLNESLLCRVPGRPNGCLHQALAEIGKLVRHGEADPPCVNSPSGDSQTLSSTGTVRTTTSTPSSS
jgi:hypothetical protein